MISPLLARSWRLFKLRSRKRSRKQEVALSVSALEKPWVLVPTFRTIWGQKLSALAGPGMFVFVAASWVLWISQFLIGDKLRNVKLDANLGHIGYPFFEHYLNTSVKPEAVVNFVVLLSCFAVVSEIDLLLPCVRLFPKEHSLICRFAKWNEAELMHNLSLSNLSQIWKT